MQLPLTPMLRLFALTTLIINLPSPEARAQASDGTAKAPRLSPTSSVRGMPEKVQTASALRRNVAEPGMGVMQLAAVRLPQDRPTLTDPPAPLGPVRLPQDESPSDAPSSDAAPQSSRKDQNALAPIQSREMNIQVSVVDISIGGLGTGVLPESTAPTQSELGDPVMGSHLRLAASKCVYWRSSQICHLPLYFEDPMLERHGHVRFGRLQTWASGLKFFSTIPLLPYLSTLQPPNEPVYALGQWRPGSCAPLVRDSIPWDARAAVVESLSLATFFWAAPL